MRLLRRRLACALRGHRLEPEDGTCLRCDMVDPPLNRGLFGPTLYIWDGERQTYWPRRFRWW